MIKFFLIIFIFLEYSLLMFFGRFERVFETTLIVFYTKVRAFAAGKVAVLQLWEHFDLRGLLLVCLKRSRVILALS